MPDLLSRLQAGLAERYTVECEVGRGGMATVFQAQDLRHQRPVALKVLHPEIALSLGSERFLREIQIAARLQHPHIVPLYDSGQVAPERSDGSALLYYVMPFVAGETLRKRLDRKPPLTLREAVEIGHAVASALDYAHRQQVVHRDIKPENVMMHDGEAVVTDFGIAKAVTVAVTMKITLSGTAVGTPAYMSPEQAFGEDELDARSDIYSLGAMLYEMITGATPFAGPTMQGMIARLLTEPVPPLRKRRPDVPEWLERAVMTAMAKVPSERHATAADFAEALTWPGSSYPAVRRVSRPVAAAASPVTPLVAVPGARIFVVDDDDSIRETIADHLIESGHEVTTFPDAARALSALQSADPALIITDVRMPGLSGLELLEKVKAVRPDTDVIVMTAHEDMKTTISAMKAGAYDYLVKPLDLDNIDLVIGRCLRDRTLRTRAHALAAVASEPLELKRLVGRHPAMIETYKLIGQVADSRTAVLIRGETGTGKELVARAIHFNSQFADAPFVAMNCTAVAEPLLESELFGHVRGAFTGAVSERRGRFELAGKGTLFLDEIGDTSPAFQSRLLRVLQEHEFTPVGGERTRRTEARVIAATNRDIEALVREGRFREDLYYRLRVVEIRVPPLRERREDIPLLVTEFVDRICRDMHLAQVTVSASALKALGSYDWPGNVRELENALNRAVVMARGGVIGTEHLSLGAVTRTTPNGPEAVDDSLESVERAQVQRVLAKTEGNKRQACKLLGISRPTLDRLIEKYGLANGRVKELDLRGQET
jgi:DNA-binding NtrC family response regulator/tRNA A-37 threonylcarbamoyl transferase component Bud32